MYVDGSSRGNPGPGGWAMIVMNEDENEVVYVAHNTETYTTNNRMELRAILCAFEWAVEHPDDQIIIFSDSSYAVNSVNQWMRGWARNGWRNSKKQIVDNADLMRALYEYLVRPFFNAKVRKCAGHSGEVGNELADAMATASRNKYNQLLNYWEIAARY